MADIASPADLRRALLSHVAGDAAAAEAGYRRAVENPQLADVAQRYLIRLLESEHRWDDALAQSRAALAAQPNDATLKVQLADSLLRAGAYAEGWPLLEARAALAPGQFRPKSAPYPEWDGRPIRSLVVWDEQGFGDSIQFSRFIPVLVARGIAVTVMARPQLTELLAGLGAQMLTAGGTMNVPMADAWAMMASLPGRLGVTLDSLAGQQPYLSASPARTAAWAERLRGARIGIAGKVRSGPGNEAARSLPPEARAFLLSLPGAVNLLPDDHGLPVENFADTAGAMAALDLVISLDTAAAHLAGALGKPCWVLAPYVGSDWRWGREQRETPWYPSVRIYRQPTQGDWAGVLRAVAQDLPAFFGQA